MKLSTRTRYGVRAMLEIALHGNNHPVDLNKISENQEISKKYLHNLLMHLKNGGFITSIRGKSGGYLLAKKPEDINLYDLFQTLEGSVDLVECIGNDDLCERSVICTTRKLWSRISHVIKNELENTTLQDLLDDCSSNENNFVYEI